MDSAWTTALAIAERQHAVLTRRQALAAGLSPAQWASAHEHRRLVSVLRGVSRLAGSPVCRRQQIMAAVLAAGPGAAAARTTAVELLDLRGCRRSTTTVAVVVAHVRRVSLGVAWAHLHRCRTLTGDQMTVVDGIQVTDAARTVCDLAIEHTVGAVREVAADALRRGLTDLSELDERSRRAGPTAGARRRRVAIRHLDPDASHMRSRLESTVPPLLARAGLPRPSVAYKLVERDRILAELDFAYPERKTAIEIDGYWWHSTPQQKAHDEQRINALTSRGWRVLRFSEYQLRNHPEHVIRAIRRTLETVA